MRISTECTKKHNTAVANTLKHQTAYKISNNVSQESGDYFTEQIQAGFLCIEVRTCMVIWIIKVNFK